MQNDLVIMQVLLQFEASETADVKRGKVVA